MDKLRRTRTFQPVADRCSDRSPRPAGSAARSRRARRKAARMLADIADAIAREAAEIFRQLERGAGRPWHGRKSSNCGRSG